MDKPYESKMDQEQGFDKESKRERKHSDVDDGSRGNQKSYSKSSLSNKSSSKCEIQVKESGINMPRYYHKNRERDKDNERETSRKFLGGRVEKHKRATPRRRGRRAPKKRPRMRAERRRRDLSMSTVVTTLSSGSRTPACVHCGHRCCQRRYEYFCRRREKLRNDRNMEQVTYKDDKGAVNQVGSRCAMLSPLFIKTNSALTEQDLQNTSHCEISPEMIYQALRRLTMRRQEVKSDAILEYIKCNYPVDPDMNTLSAELEEKLRIAAIVGIVTRLTADHWCLPSALLQRSLTKTHVSQFWQAYIDTMRPVTRKEEVVVIPEVKEPERNKTLYDKIKESCYL